MTAATYLDQPTAGWFALDVMKENSRKREWVALMIDVHSADLKILRELGRSVPGIRYSLREAWLRVPGKHRNKEAAWGALQDMLAPRH
jgi:hypothetical protein